MEAPLPSPERIVDGLRAGSGGRGRSPACFSGSLRSFAGRADESPGRRERAVARAATWAVRGEVIAVTHGPLLLDNVAPVDTGLDRAKGFPGREIILVARAKERRMAVEQRTEDKRRKAMARELEWIRQFARGPAGEVPGAAFRLRAMLMRMWPRRRGCLKSSYRRVRGWAL